MSTKTTLKRIALVAVSALTAGFFAIPSANAGAAAAGSLSLGTGYPARALATFYQPVTFTLTSGTLLAGDTIFVDAQLLAKPTGSAVTSDSMFFDAGSTSTAQDTNANLVLDQITQSGRTGKTSFGFYSFFEPDVAGTYQFLIYSPSTAETAYVSGRPSTVLTITANAGAPVSGTFTAIGGATTVSGAKPGALLALTLKDAAGNVTIPNKFETVTISYISSGSKTVTMDLGYNVAGDAGSAGATTTTLVMDQDAFFGGEADFNAWQAAASAADDSVAFTATVSGATSGTLGTTVVTYKKYVAAATESLGKASTTTNNTGGYATFNAAGNSLVDPSLTSHSWSLTIAAGAVSATLSQVFPVRVADTYGAVSGYAGYAYTLPVTVAATKDTADFSVAGAFAAGYSYGLKSLTNATTVVPTTNTDYTASVFSPNASVTAATGSATTFVATVKNAYGVAIPNVIVAITQAGRNAKVTTTNIVTNSSGQVSYTVTDASTSTSNFKDTITFTPTGGASNTAVDGIVNYVTALNISSVTVTGGSTADTVAYGQPGATTFAISTGSSGAGAGVVTFTATVKDANGVLLSGIPVTWTVDKATSGITKSATVDSAICYTGGAGTCTTTVYSWEAPSKVTVTATAGGKSGTGYANYVNAATDARVVSATAASNVVTAKVVDRYGNPVAGVNLAASTTAGYFGTGASSSLGVTGADGTVKFILLGANSATVTVGASNADVLATYTQLDDAAGKIGATAVTAAVAGTSTGVGSSLAPAGVQSASVAVTVTPDTAAVDAANAASDAAAEAIDAANAATDAANLAAEAADAATVAAEEARDAADAATAAVEELATQVATLMAALKAQITTLANTVAKIAKKVKA